MSLALQHGMVIGIIVAAMVYVAYQAKLLLFPGKAGTCGTSCGGCTKENTLGTSKPFVASEQLGNFSSTKLPPSETDPV